MRTKSRKIEDLLIRTLAENQPLGASEFYRKVCARLKKGETVSEPTFYRYLKDLEKKGVFEKTGDGKWRLNKHGLLKMHRVLEINRLLNECRLISSALSDAYASFPHDSSDAAFYLGAKFSEIIDEVAEEVICRFYREATIAFLMSQPEEDNILEFYDKLVQGLGQATITSLMTQRAKQYLEFYDKLLQELGLAIWLGIKAIFGICKRTESLWQIVDRLTKDAEGLDRLSTYLLHGLERVFAEDDAARMFLKVLHHVGFLGELVFILINQDRQRAEQILSAITGPPREGEVDWQRIKSFIKWLMALKAVGIITISADHFASLAGRVAINDFESWLRDLKAGTLDHRPWIFGRPPGMSPEVKSGKEILKTLIKHPEWLQPQDGLLICSWYSSA